MHRIGARDAAFRSYHSMARGTINEANDKTKMQEVSVDLFRNDGRTKVERVQNYGQFSVPLPRDNTPTGQKKSPDGFEAEKGPAAEAIVMFPGGTRNHPVVVAIDDRRHRPKNAKPGEAGNYDDQGQLIALLRNGAYVASNKERASLRHTSKKLLEAGTGDANTEVYCTEKSVFVKVGSKFLAEVVGEKVYLGGRVAEGIYSLVVTEAGPAMNVYARVG